MSVRVSFRSSNLVFEFSGLLLQAGDLGLGFFVLGDLLLRVPEAFGDPCGIGIDGAEGGVDLSAFLFEIGALLFIKGGAGDLCSEFFEPGRFPAYLCFETARPAV